jgi:TonB family protein
MIRGTAIVREIPAYDRAALASGAQGDVHAVLTISERGIVQDVRVIDGDQVFAEQVRAAAAHWRYTPFLSDFGPVSVDLPITFRFRLRVDAGVIHINVGRSN